MLVHLKSPRGQVWAETNVEPYVAYHVNPEWITNFLQGNKISLETARKAYIRCAKGAETNLRNLACLERLEEERQIHDLECAVKLKLAPQYCAQKIYPEVEFFLHEHSVLKDRYKFLVLTGPSGMGKTVRAQFVPDCRRPAGVELRRLL